MPVHPKVACACGRQVEAREVLRHGCFMSRWQPVWVYLKYRCSRCRMVGEKLISYREWSEGMSAGEVVASEPDDAGCLPVLGEIEDDELQKFFAQVRHLRRSDLDALARDLS